MTTHAPFGLLVQTTDFHHIPKASSRDACTSLSFPDIQLACANWTSTSNLSQHPVALLQPHQPTSGQACLPLLAVSPVDFSTQIEQGFWFHALAIPRWPVSLSPNLVTHQVD